MAYNKTSVLLKHWKLYNNLMIHHLSLMKIVKMRIVHLRKIEGQIQILNHCPKSESFTT